MDELDRKIIAELTRTAQAVPQQSGAAGAEVKNVMEMVIQQNAATLRKMKWWFIAWHVFLLAALIYGAYLVVFKPNTEETPAGVFIRMAALAGAVVIKVVYHLMAVRLSLETKLKGLELNIAEVREAVRELKR